MVTKTLRPYLNFIESVEAVIVRQHRDLGHFTSWTFMIDKKIIHVSIENLENVTTFKLYYLRTFNKPLDITKKEWVETLSILSGSEKAIIADHLNTIDINGVIIRAW
jgi:hypothetical protein